MFPGPEPRRRSDQPGAAFAVFTRLGLIRVVRLNIALGLVAVIVAGIVGQIVRDRSAAIAILFYLPLLPASLAAVVFDLARRGRGLPASSVLTRRSWGSSAAPWRRRR